MLLLSPPLYLMIVRKGEMSNNFFPEMGRQQNGPWTLGWSVQEVVTWDARWTAAKHTPTCNVTTALVNVLQVDYFRPAGGWWLVVIVLWLFIIVGHRGCRKAIFMT